MSASLFKDVSISVSGDESDELAEKMRVRVRRKRKRLGFRGNKALFWRLIRKIFKWWPIFIIVFAVSLLLFEEYRIRGNSNLAIQSDGIRDKKTVSLPEKRSEGNLNRLTPTTRVVAGVRERCLKLLSLEELQRLDIPVGDAPATTVREVVYLSENNTPYRVGDSTPPQHRAEATRFNLFTGNQTLEERAKSFKVSETAVVHCGFYSENGGYNISNEDKIYMQTCKVVVSTCAFGGGDDLYQPIGLTDVSLRKVCYVAFWDEITVSTQELAGHHIGEDHFIGKWRIVVVRNLPFTDQRLNGKIPKMLGHRLFPYARYSIWVDSKSQFRRDPLGVLEALLWRSNSVLAISEHGARSSVYDEAKAVVKKNKATPEEVEVQMAQYRRDGFPDDKRYNGKKALSEASVIVREHTPLTNLLMCLWFNEAVRFTSRDQLSFPYVLRQLDALKNINMFPVCTRKDLVNSMGHLRKAKPLVA